MASYDALINLKLSSQGLKDLKRIESAVDKINKPVRTASTRSRVEQKLAKSTEARRVAMIETRRVGDLIQKGVDKGLKLSKARNAVDKSSLANQKGEFKVSKAQLKIALDELNAQTKVTEQLSKQTQLKKQIASGKFATIGSGGIGPQLAPMQGPAMGPTSMGLNFDKRTGKLLRGRAGSNPNTLRNLGRRFHTQSALISGAFPLLFGQGPVGALAGGLGGGIGGMFGQMGGFAGGIAATALAQQIQQLIGSLGNLGKAMSPFVQDTNALINSMGLAGTAEAKRIQIIEQLQGKQAAFNAAMQKMKETIGTEATKRLEEFGQKASLVGSEFKIAMLKMQAALLPLINAVDKFLGVSKGAEKARLDRFIENSKNTSIVNRREELKSLRENKDARGKVRDPKREAQLEKELEQIARIGIALEDQRVKMSEITLEHDKLVQKAQEEKDLKEAIKKLTETGMSQAVAKEVAQREQVRDKVLENLDGLRDSLNIQRAQLTNEEEDRKTLEKIDKLLADILDKRKQILGETEKAVKATIDQGNEIKKVKVTKEEIANLLADEMTNALMGLIEGTKSLGESLASIAKSLAKMFLNAAFQNIFNNVFSIKGEQGLYSRSGGFKAFKQGGVVSSPMLGLIGEGGESEYVIPSSKMDGAMARYSAGARGGAVIPGGSHESGTVAGGSGNAIVEYTGPVLNFNGDEYVPKSAVPEIIGAATKQGAMAGKAQVIGTLRNSRSQRASLGL